MEEGEGGGGFQLGKKNSGKGVAGAGEVDYKTKAGTAWSHSFLNQKPWHPLSYPNQRRKWIAEQTHANRERRVEEVAREFAQEQEFFRQTALFSKKEKEKVEMMKAVSFMYVRPPGYNAESAKAAEVADERNKLDQNNTSQDSPMIATKPDKNLSGEKKARPKDVFGRSLPTEEEFDVLKNAPSCRAVMDLGIEDLVLDEELSDVKIKSKFTNKTGHDHEIMEIFSFKASKLETGMPARAKPFGVEIRNVRCVRCGTFGHQSGDRECPLKDVIMPNEENRLKRDDPLTAIMAQTDSSEPLKWELKQKPGLSPPRGGFQPDDPNQQIVAEEIFDEYGGFLSGGDIPALLSNFSTKKPKKHSKHKSKHKHHLSSGAHNERKHRYGDRLPSSSDSEVDRERRKKAKSRHKKRKGYHSESGGSDGSDSERHGNGTSSSDSEDKRERKRRAKSKHMKKKRYRSESSRYEGSDLECHGYRSPSSDSEDDRERKRSTKRKHKHKKRSHLESSRNYSSDSERHHGHRYSSDSEVDRERKRRAKGKRKEERCHFESFDLDHHHRPGRR